MLQVPPTGLQPSRPAAKVPHPEPADAGFPAIALLAAAQLPTPTQPGPVRADEVPRGPDAREASVSQQSAEPGRSGATKPVHSREEDPEVASPEASPAPKETLTSDSTPAGPAAAAVEPGSNPAQATPTTLPLPIPATAIPQPVASVPQMGAAAASVGPADVLKPTEVPNLGDPAPPVDPPAVAGKAAQSVGTERPVPGQPPATAEFPATLAEAAAQEAPLSEAAHAQSGTPQTTAAQVAAVLPVLGKTGRPAIAKSPAGIPLDTSQGADPMAANPDPAIGADPAPTLRPAQRPSLAAALNAGPTASGSLKAAQPEVPFQAPPALPVNVRFSGPAGPARPAEVEPATKDPAKAAEPRRPAEDAQPRRAEAATPAADSGAARPVPSTTESATALPRSESLGMQPPQLQSATPSGSPTPVAARVESAATWQVPVPTVPQQVENSIRWMLRNASPGAELQLHPDALGRVRIELKVEGGEVHARLWASDPKSIPVLQEHKAFLEVSLKEQGLNLGSFDLRQNANQSHPGLTDGQSRGQFWPTEAGSAEPRQDAPSRPALRSANPRRIELIA